MVIYSASVLCNYQTSLLFIADIEMLLDKFYFDGSINGYQFNALSSLNFDSFLNKTDNLFIIDFESDTDTIALHQDMALFKKTVNTYLPMLNFALCTY